MSRTLHYAFLPAVLWAALLAVCGAAVAAAQAPAPPAGERFGEEISITEIEIPVHVLRRGEPVRGLAAEDFLVFDEGEPRALVGFRVIDLGAPALPPAEPATAETALADDGRRILFLFDFLFSRPHHLERALDGAREMIVEQLHPTDRVGVAYLTGGGANLLLGFTGDRPQALTAIAALQAIFDGRQQEAREHLAELSRPRRGGGGEGEGLALTPTRTQAGELSERFGAAAAVAMLGGGTLDTGNSGSSGDSFFGVGLSGTADGFDISFDDPTLNQLAALDAEQIGETLAAAGEASAILTLAQEIGRLATLLRDVPGQKQMLYLSEGFGSGIIESFAAPQRALALRYLDDMFEALRRGGWTLNAVDVEGVPEPFGGRGFDAHALHYMADATGGQIFENYTRVGRATAKLMARTSVTYVLTIRPGELPANGALRRLEVRLRQPRAATRVLHRTAYHAPKPAAERSALERRLDAATLLLGAGETSELDARVLAIALPATGAAAAASPGGALTPLSFVVEVPAADLFGAGGGPELEIQVYAVDERGGVQDTWLRKLELANVRLPKTADLALAGGGLRVLDGVSVPPGVYRLRTLVRDVASGRSFLGTTDVATGDEQGSLLPVPPLAIDRSGTWLELASLPRADAGSAWELFYPGGGAAPVTPPVRLAVHAWEGLELLLTSSALVPLELGGRVLDADGREMADARVELVERLDDGLTAFHRHLARVETDLLAPGSYLLEITAVPTDGAREDVTAVRTLAFAVER